MSLRNELWIDGRWTPGTGSKLASTNPANEQQLWEGGSATADEVATACQAARDAFPTWQATSLEKRMEICREFARLVKENADEFALLVSRESGKPIWESKTEIAAVAGKIELAIQALHERRLQTEVDMPGAHAIVRYQPYGVMGVLGPFNLPAHLPNGHIVPSLLAGNTVVFKPSELTPAIGAFMVSLWDQTELPHGVINLVQGGRETGAALIGNSQLDGLLFTGSSNAGMHFHRLFADHPEKILALEMGGNAPLVVSDVEDLPAAAYQTVLSAFITAGQRCTCARRLIVVENEKTAEFLSILCQMIRHIQVGLPTDEPEPFMGTLISKEAAQQALDKQEERIEAGAEVLELASRDDRSQALLRPGLIDVTILDHLPDEEIFGPLLQLKRVASFDEAIASANETKYGLAAGLLSNSLEQWEQFRTRVRAGIINWNRQTTGASGRLPFGGVGLSGNHRPSGFYACDYCSFPVASLEASSLQMPEKLLPGLEKLAN